MPIVSLKSSSDPASDVARQSLVGLLLTSVHHVYGAYIYTTPWRYHVLFITGPAALVIAGSLALFHARAAGLPNTLARWLLALTALVVPVLLFGVFEGFYNHVLKDVLYFAGASAEQMTRLFPPPRYEMPDDALFEITGVLQVVPAALAARHLYGMVAGRRTERAARQSAPVRQPAHSEEEARAAS